MREKTCCFTGHRRLPTQQLQAIQIRLETEIEKLIRMGVSTFISGGAIGFDQMAADIVIAKKELGIPLKLIFALPCPNQEKYWSKSRIERYERLLFSANQVIYTSSQYSIDCMRKRNHYMVDQSAYCICAFLNEASGTGQTVRYAQQNGLHIVNVAVLPRN